MNVYKFCPQCGTALIDKEIENKNRRVCPADSCGFVQWNNPIPVVTAMIQYEGRVILARNAAWPQKVFGLITGFLEQGESPEQGIVREIKEEIGLHGTIQGFLGLYPFTAQNQLLIAFDVIATGELVLSSEIAEVRQLEPAKVRPWDFGTGLVVKDWLQKRGLGS